MRLAKENKIISEVLLTMSDRYIEELDIPFEMSYKGNRFSISFATIVGRPQSFSPISMEHNIKMLSWIATYHEPKEVMCHGYMEDPMLSENVISLKDLKRYD